VKLLVLSYPTTPTLDSARPSPLQNGASVHARITTTPVVTRLDKTMSRTLSTLGLRSPIQSHIRAGTRQFTSTSTLASRLRQPGEPTGPNEPPSHTSAPPSKSPLKVWPIVGLFALGGFLFKKIVDQRAAEGQYRSNGPVAGHSPSRP
jgi:hypothetical protein